MCKDPELNSLVVPELPILRFVAGPQLLDQLWRLLRYSAEMSTWYMTEMVFPRVLQQQARKLTASGQELGSEMLFRARLGFSGTPSSAPDGRAWTEGWDAVGLRRQC